MPKYGDKTAKELDKYIKGYTLPKGRTRTGLIAPVKDLLRNYKTMKSKNLDPSDKFFHCKTSFMSGLLEFTNINFTIITRKKFFVKSIINTKALTIHQSLCVLKMEEGKWLN